MDRSVSTYLVTQGNRTGGRGTAAVVERALDAGIDAVQLREKHASAAERYNQGRDIRALTAAAGVPFIVNDRVDLALALDADGVHLGDDDLPIAVAREQLGADAVVGRSVSSPAAARTAERAGADYLGVGAVFATDTKDTAAAESAIGVETVAAVDETVSIPIVGIGGVTPDNADRVIDAGADAVAVVTAVSEADDPAAATTDLNAAVEGAEGAVSR